MKISLNVVSKALLAGLLAVAPSIASGQYKVEPSEVVDLGEIEEGKVVTVDFKITNQSAATHTVGPVKTSCGCTTAEPSLKEIKPGETTVVTASYDSKNRPGPFNREITVFMNGSGSKPVTVFMKGEVVSPSGPRLVLDANRINLGVQAFRQRVTVSVPIRNKGTEPLVVQTAELDKKNILKEPLSVPPGSSYTLAVDVPSPETEGMYSGVLTLTSNDPSRRRAVISVLGWYEQRQGVVVVPEREVNDQVIVRVTSYISKPVMISELMPAGSYQILAGKEVLQQGEGALLQVKKGTEVRYRL
ncbi:MAG: DUF1573 domain-containing protein [Bacteroidetes bacterium]|nr:DUF1573 domain-containing protein [Bacteroidota bacterium]